MKRIAMVSGLIVMALLTWSNTMAQQSNNMQKVHCYIRDIVKQKALAPFAHMDTTEEMTIAISLPLRNHVMLNNLLRQIYTPQSTDYHHYLTVSQFTNRFGPSSQDYQSLISFVKTHGLRVVSTYPNRVLLDVRGTVSRIEKTLHTRIGIYRRLGQNRYFFAPDHQPAINLNIPVLNISGLTDYFVTRSAASTDIEVAPMQVTTQMGSGPQYSYWGNDFREAYANGVSLTGAGQTLGLVEFANLDTSYVGYYEDSVHVSPHVPIDVELVDETSAQSAANPLSEIYGDAETAISMAPGLSNILVYEAPYDSAAGATGWDDMLDSIATQDYAQQISCSWNYTSPVNPAGEEILEEMDCQGQ